MVWAEVELKPHTEVATKTMQLFGKEGELDVQMFVRTDSKPSIDIGMASVNLRPY